MYLLDAEYSLAYCPLTTKEHIRSIFLERGASAVGFATAEKVPDEEWNHFQSWIDSGRNAGMDYMNNYPDLRRDPTQLFPGTKTVIVLAFNYTPAVKRNNTFGTVASYAYYPDYHKSIRKMLKNTLSEFFGNRQDISWRICIDSAPVLERFWAVKSGIGFRGDNGMIIVPGVGSRVFLAEILTGLPLEPDSPLEKDCGHCSRCSEACPGKALQPGGTIDCRRCISYLTIEHRGQWDKIGTEVMNTPQGKNTIFGCDRCIEVCPWNSPAPHSIFRPLPEVLSLTKESVKALDESGFRSQLGDTPLFRAGYDGIRRNIINLYTH